MSGGGVAGWWGDGMTGCDIIGSCRESHSPTTIGPARGLSCRWSNAHDEGSVGVSGAPASDSCSAELTRPVLVAAVVIGRGGAIMSGVVGW